MSGNLNSDFTSLALFSLVIIIIVMVGGRFFFCSTKYLQYLDFVFFQMNLPAKSGKSLIIV